jgi:hypothetical protein
VDRPEIPVCLLALVALTACAPAPPPAPKHAPDPTAESWYAPAVDQLTANAVHARALWKSGRSDEAAKLITDSQPQLNRVIAAPHPTLAAMQAASDLDDLYGRMLLANGRSGWARLQFQKNVIRWKNWRPLTTDSAERLRTAQSAIAACDGQIER